MGGSTKNQKMDFLTSKEISIMYFSERVMEDGYVEQIVSLSEECSPIFRLRAVLGSDGEYSLVIRDFKSGSKMDDSFITSKSWWSILYEGQKKCHYLLRKVYSKEFEGDEFQSPPSTLYPLSSSPLVPSQL